MFELGGAGTYQGRVYSWGRDKAVDAFKTFGEVPDGMEQYLVQFWSA
jgi:hypothetical protein